MNQFPFILPLLWCIGAVTVHARPLAKFMGPSAPSRQFHQEPAWQPRAHPSVEDVVGGKFLPARLPLPRPVKYDTPGFAAERLHSLEPKLDRLDAQPDAHNLWSAERTLVASADPDPRFTSMAL